MDRSPIPTRNMVRIFSDTGRPGGCPMAGQERKFPEIHKNKKCKMQQYQNNTNIRKIEIKLPKSIAKNM